MFYKLGIILSFQFLVFVFGTRENVVINLPELDESQLNWTGLFEERLDTLKYLLNTLTKNGNVTLVGWQRIYRKDGTFSGIRTIELTILTLTRPQQSLSSESIGIYSEIYVLQDLISDFESLDISLAGSFNQYDTDGLSTDLIEIESNNIKAYTSDEDTLQWKHIINEDSLESVQDFIFELKSITGLPVALLHWDKNGDFDSVNSKIVPEALLTVYSAADANVTVLDTALEALWRGTIIHSQNVSTHITDFLIEKIPEYTWLVTSDTISSAVKYQIYLEVANSVDILTADTYYIYGI